MCIYIYIYINILIYAYIISCVSNSPPASHTDVAQSEKLVAHAASARHLLGGRSFFSSSCPRARARPPTP